MRFSVSLLAAGLFLVGAGCSSTTDVSIQPNQTEPTPAPIVDLEASSTVQLPMVTSTDQKPAEKPTGSEPVACTMDAKQCPDGSFVGRTGPKCEFAPCPTPKPTEPTPTGPKTYTLAEVQAKAAAGQCWTVISGQVYNLTDWITKHPGGQTAIKSLCGIDGTAKFQAMHGGDARPQTVLSGYLVGSLK